MDGASLCCGGRLDVGSSFVTADEMLWGGVEMNLCQKPLLDAGLKRPEKPLDGKSPEHISANTRELVCTLEVFRNPKFKKKGKLLYCKYKMGKRHFVLFWIIK